MPRAWARIKIWSPPIREAQRVDVHLSRPFHSRLPSGIASWNSELAGMLAPSFHSKRVTAGGVYNGGTVESGGEFPGCPKPGAIPR